MEILNTAVKVTPVPTITALTTYMADKRTVDFATLRVDVVELVGTSDSELGQIIVDSGFIVVDE